MYPASESEQKSADIGQDRVCRNYRNFVAKWSCYQSAGGAAGQQSVPAQVLVKAGPCLEINLRTASDGAWPEWSDLDLLTYITLHHIINIHNYTSTSNKSI